MQAKQDSIEAKVPCGPTTVYNEVNIAMHELTTAPVQANLPSRGVRDDSLSLASCEAAPISSSSKAKMSGVALKRRKAKARLSNEAKAKAPLGASAAPARSGANVASLKVIAQRTSAKLTSNNEVKALNAMPASHGEAKSSGEAILASLITKKKAFKAKPRAFQPNRANNQSSRVFVLDWLVLVSTDLRDYLSNK